MLKENEDLKNENEEERMIRKEIEAKFEAKIII